MNNQIMAVTAALMLTGAAAAAQPGSKPANDQGTAVEICEKVALAKVPGQVLERHVQKYPTGFNYEYLIKTKDGRKLVVEVDGKTRKVFAIMDTAVVKTDDAPEEEAEAPSPE